MLEWDEEAPGFAELLNELAVRAFTEARQRVLDSGRSVVEEGVVDGRTVLVRVSHDGEPVVLKELPPDRPVQKGLKIKLR